MNIVRHLIAATTLAAAPAAGAMECVSLETWPGGPALWRCLGLPAVSHPRAYWLEFGMVVRPVSGFTLRDPIARVRCGTDSFLYFYPRVIWQTYITVTYDDGTKATIEKPRDVQRFDGICPCNTSVWSGK